MRWEKSEEKKKSSGGRTALMHTEWFDDGVVSNVIQQEGILDRRT